MKNWFLILISIVLILGFTNLGLAQPFPYTEDFENGGSIPAGWTNDTTDSGKDWDFGTSVTYGATGDHTSGSGYFAYLDDSSPHPTLPTNLISPSFDITGLTSPELVFWYWSYNEDSTPSDSAWLHIDVWDGSVWNMDVIDSIGSEAMEWRNKVVDLTPYQSASTMVRFRITESTEFYHDISLDDVSIREMPSGPIFSVAPDTGNFGTVLVNDSSSAQTFTITNTGVGTLTIDPAPSITGTNASEFFITDTNSYPVNLNAAESMVLDVTFAPTSGGSKTANLTITDNLGTHDVPLFGDGFDPTVTTYPYMQDFENGGSIPLGWVDDPNDSGKDWDYGTSAGHGAGSDHTTGSGYFAYMDDSSPNPTTATNLLSPPLDLTSLTSPEMVFWYWSFNDRSTPVDTAYLHIDVWDGSVWHLDVIDSIGSEAMQWSSKTVDLSAYQSAATVVRFRVLETPSFYHDIGIDDVTVREMPAVPIFSVAPDTGDFGTVLINMTSANTTFTVSNVGVGTLILDPAPTLTGTDAAEFVLSDTNTYPVSLNAGESTTMDVAFAPTSAGSKTANLTITDNTGTHDVPLLGVGLDPTVTTYPYVQDFDAFPSGITFGHIAEGWSNPAVGDSGDWTVDANGTPSTGTGPSGDHTSGSGNYLFTEASSGGNPGSPGQSAYLVSPPLDLTSLTAPNLTFWYHMYGGDMGELHVDVWDGTTWNLDIVPPVAGDQGDMWFERSAPLGAFSGTINVRFRGITGSGFESDMAVDDVSIAEASAVDMAVTDILNLPSTVISGSTVNFDVTVANLGANTVTNDTLDIWLNGSLNSSYPVATLNFGEADTIAASVTATAAGRDSVVAALRLVPGDANPANDTLGAAYDVQAAMATPYFQDFDGLDPTVADTVPAGWTNEVGDDLDWDADNNGTGSTGTGPANDHTTGTTGNYMYTEATGAAAGDVALLTTPFMDLSGLTTPALEFWYHMYGGAMGELHVDLWSGGVWTNDIAPPLIGQQQTSDTAPWKKSAIDLSAWSGSVVKVRFRGIIGTSFTSDMAIDDVFFGEATPDIQANRVDMPVLTMIPFTQTGIVSNIALDGEFSNLGPQNTGDINVEVSDTNTVAYSDALTGVTFNGFSDSTFSLSPWDASGAAAGTYDIDIYSSNFTDANPSNDTASFGITLGDQMAFDNGVQSTSGTFSSSARSWFAVRYSLTDDDTLTSVSILVSASTLASDSFAVELWSTSNDTPSTPMATIFEGTYGDLGPLPALVNFQVIGGMPLSAGDYAVVFDMKQQNNPGGSFPCGVDYTAQGAQNVPRTFWGKLETTTWLVFEEVGAETWTPIMRAGFQETGVIHDFAVDQLDANACFVVGTPDTVTARVRNVGNQPETSVTVELRENGVFAGDVIVSLNPGESTTAVFPYTPSDTGLVNLEVVSLLSGDVNPGNDVDAAYVRVMDSGVDIVFQDDFEDTTFTMNNWTVVDDPTSTVSWMIFPPPYPNAYTLPITSRGNVFSADSDEGGSGSVTITTAIISGDMSGYQSAQLDFDSDWNAFDAQDTARVNVSSDGGATWTTVLEYAGVDSFNQHVSLDLTAYLAGSPNAMIAFESYQPGWDWWWAIDNVCVSGAPLSGMALPFWEGFNDTALFGGIPTGWTQIDADGGDEIPGADWQMTGTPVSNVAPLEGPGYIADNYQAANAQGLIDEWLITPQLTNYQSGMELSFWLNHVDGPWDDSVMVMVSTTGNNPGDFTQIDYINCPITWTQYSYNLGNYGVSNGDNIYIAFRYLIVNGGSAGTHSNYFGLEDVHVEFPPAPPVEKLLLSEIVVTPTEGEFIEIYNPTQNTVDLTDYYLTDATFAGGGQFYYKIVSGIDYGGGGFGDFHARFPNGAMIQPGEYQSIALNGDADFTAAYGVTPTYEMDQAEHASGVPDGIPDMLEAVQYSIFGPDSLHNPGLTNGDEVVVLYHWNGMSDLVGDVDYLLYNSGSPTPNDEAVDKTGVVIDGPDPDTTGTAYLPDTPTANQMSAPSHSGGSSVHRIDFTEGAQVTSGGNGVTGGDETSEDLNNTFTNNSIPSPNASWRIQQVAKLLLTEIVARPTGAEFIEIYNPNAGDVDLSNYYVANSTFQGGNVYYYQLVEGGGGGGGFADFNSRFPDGAMIQAGEYQTIALQGDSSFFDAYGVLPTYELYEDNSNFANDVPDMREAVTGSVNGQGGLTDGDEDVVLYYWDGMSDLVGDVDYLIYDEGDGGINEQVDKTGVVIDGPDPDTLGSAYLPDTPIASQVPAPLNNTADGFSSHRKDFSEGTQTSSGGNGVTGADETSENLDSTWTANSLPTPNAPWQPAVFEFFDDFESYTAGTQLTVQTTEWTTWSGTPGTTEDPFVSNAQAFSGSNSLVIAPDNDVVKSFGKLDSAKWKMSFQMYIPNGKAGYFNTLTNFDPPGHANTEWGMEVYFDVGGGGRLIGVPAGTVNFNFAYDTWQLVEVIVDLDADAAQFFFDGSLVNTWQWTQGGANMKQLDANDLFGATANDEMYVDDYRVEKVAVVGVGDEGEILSTIPEEFALYQNYPNPFNPTTTIKYDLKQNVDVELTIYNILGQEVRTLVNARQEAGKKTVVWDGLNNYGSRVASGIYIYRIHAADFVESRKMIMLK